MSSLRGRTVAALHQGLDSKTAHFISWLEQRGAYDNQNAALSIGMSSHGGRGLFAARPVHSGERMLEIPCDLMITSDRLPKEVLKCLPGDASRWTQLALFLLAECNRGKESQWYPFVNMLPRPGELDHTVFWSNEELECVKHSPLYLRSLQRKEVLTQEYSAVQKALQHCSHVFGNHASCDAFFHAYSTVASRSWKIDGVCGLAMVPCMDLLNHDWTSRSLLSYEPEKNCVAVVADRDYAEGQEVSISYGDVPNATLAVDYGFALAYNQFDEVELWLTVSPEEPCYQDKLQALSSKNIHILEHVSGRVGRRFLLENTELSRQGISSDICEFARTIYGSSSSGDADQALLPLSSLLEDAVQQYVSAELAGSVYGIENITRREIARAVLDGELRCLRIALEKLRLQLVRQRGVWHDNRPALALCPSRSTLCS